MMMITKNNARENELYELKLKMGIANCRVGIGTGRNVGRKAQLCCFVFGLIKSTTENCSLCNFLSIVLPPTIEIGMLTNEIQSIEDSSQFCVEIITSSSA